MKLTQRNYGIIGGLALLIMAFSAFFAFGYVYSSLVIPNNMETTLTNLQNHKLLFQLSIFAWYIIVFTDIIVTFAFYFYLKPYHHGFALTGAILRMSYTLFLIAGILKLIRVNSQLKSLNPIDILLQIQNLFVGFETLWSLGLIIFGLHLIVVGLNTFKTKDIPNILGYLLIIAGMSYSLLHGLQNTLPIASWITTLETILALPMIIGELGFGIWLLTKGGKVNPQSSSGGVPNVL